MKIHVFDRNGKYLFGFDPVAEIKEFVAALVAASLIVGAYALIVIWG